MKPGSPLLRTGPEVHGPEPDEMLMERFIGGDSTAFDALYARHAGQVHAYLRRMVGPAAADDLTQTTFLSVVRSRGRFRPGARFRSWLYAIASNAARDLARRARFEQPTAGGELPDQPVEPGLPDPALERTVRAALARLPHAQREAIVLHRFEGLSFAEIADVLGLTESAVKVRAHRGYVQLRVLLGHLGEGT
ncbi:MAG TPA: RNA polymerase sigma factor [Myxococcaceae bacterium]|nr:RNA polymerase sigma factor [Myxococcaceae bacterium]